MSSWGQGLPSQSRLKYTDFFCKISKSGYGTNYQKFFMCYLYAKYMKKKLYLCDTTSNISQSFHLILDTFQPMSNIVYTNKNGLTIFDDKIIDMNKFLLTLTDDILCSEARNIFQLNIQTQQKVDALLLEQQFPPFDIGIHVRMGDKITSGEMKEIGLDIYINSIKDAQKRLGKDKVNIYVMTDNSQIIKSISDPSWSVYSLPSPIPSTGHDQRKFNSMSTNDKMAAYYHFLAELHIMQHCGSIICTYSSNIGRFLYLTRDPQATIKSLDVADFTILHDMSIFLNARDAAL
jgi:hypothetical protein